MLPNNQVLKFKKLAEENSWTYKLARRVREKQDVYT